MKKWFAVGALLFSSLHIGAFTTLNDLEKFAQNFPEYPKSDNNNWMNPNFNSYYQSLTPNILSAWFERFGLGQQHTFSGKNFKKLLEKVIKNREQENLAGRMIAHLMLDHDAHLIVFGDMHAEVHSLIRSLRFLRNQGIIDNTLKLVKKNYYIVFNGDHVNRSAYSLETLYITLLLLHKNPENVFYLRGKHEDNNYWQNFGLKRELQIRLKHLDNTAIPLGNLVSRLFDTLPLALFINQITSPNDFIRISHSDLQNAELDSAHFAQFLLNTKKDTLSYHDVRQLAPSDDTIDINAIIKTEEWMNEHRAREGLGQLDQDNGATAWAIVSTPTMFYRAYFGFYYDAFIDLHVTQPILASTITLYHNDTRTKDGYTKEKTYSLISGSPATTDVKLKEYRIASTMPLKQGIPLIGQSVERGINLRLNKQNLDGGVSGHYIRFETLNDDYQPYRARKNITQLMKQDTKMLIAPVGDATFKSYLDHVMRNNISVLFPITGAPQFRSPALKGVIHLRATYADEIDALINHLIKEYGLYKFALFYQDDAYGTGAVDAAHETLRKNGITTWTDVSYTRGSTNLEDQAKKIEDAQPDALGLFATADAAQELIRQVGINNLANTKLFAPSTLAETSFKKFAERQGLKVLFASVVPNPATSTLPIVEEYRTLMDKNQYPYDVFSLEGYIAASLLFDRVSHIEPPLTREKIMQSFENLQNYDYKGYQLTFDPKKRSFAQYVWLETDGDWLKIPIVKNTE